MTFFDQLISWFIIQRLIILNLAISSFLNIRLIAIQSQYYIITTLVFVFLTNRARIWCIESKIFNFIIKIINMTTAQIFSKKLNQIIFIVEIFIEVWLFLIGMLHITIIVFYITYKFLKCWIMIARAVLFQCFN